MTDLESAKRFAEMLTAFVDVSARVKAIDDLDAAHAEASKRLANKSSELEAMLQRHREAQEAADKAHEAAKGSVAKVMADAQAEKARIIATANTAANQVIVNATGDAEVRKAAVEREVAALQSTRDRLAEEIDGHTKAVAGAREESADAQGKLEALKAELAALKAKF